MLRIGDEQGAVLVWVVLLVVSLFGFAAIAVDAAALYQENRELQNGADAAALAVAIDCANGDCGPEGVTAKFYADENAQDGVSEATVSHPGDGKVKVLTETVQSGSAPGELSLFFARALGIESGITTASAVAAWGPPAPGSIGGFPVVFSQCEYSQFVQDGGLTEDPETTTDPPVRIFLGGGNPNTVQPPKNPKNPPPPQEPPPTCQGAGEWDVPGNFGFLNGEDCVADFNPDGTADGAEGASKPICTPEQLEASLGINAGPIFIAIYSTSDNSCKTCEYTISGYVAFYLTGYNFDSSKYKYPKNSPPCSSPEPDCIAGYFTYGQFKGGTPNPGGAPTGVNIVSLIE